MTKPTNQSGQAAVEAALGMLVMVTILVFGIHFAEIGYLSMKLPEAAAAAMWDATAYKHNHIDTTMNMGPRSGAVSDAKTSAQNRYQDFDGRKSKTGGSLTQVFTDTSGITLTCQEDNNIAPLLLESVMTQPVFQSGFGGMWCKASTTLDLINIGSFHDNGGGFFKVDHVAQGRTNYKICSQGRAWSGGGNGNCDGKMEMLLGDWGLTGPGENSECVLSTSQCGNAGYYKNVKKLFELNGAGSGSAGAALAAAIGLPPMIDENHFFMSFRGEESSFRETVPSSHSGDQGPDYTVTPGGTYQVVPEYRNAWNGPRRDGSSPQQACWLGLPCNFGT